MSKSFGWKKKVIRYYCHYGRKGFTQMLMLEIVLWYSSMEKIVRYLNENVAPPTQGTCSNDYVSAFRLVDAWLFYGVGRWTDYIHMGRLTQTCATALVITSQHHILNITFPISHSRVTLPTLVGYLCRDRKLGCYKLTGLSYFTLPFFLSNSSMINESSNLAASHQPSAL